MIHDVASGRIDLAIAWGPAAGYFAARDGERLRIAPTPASDDGIPFQADIAIAVKKGNVALRDKLDAALERRRGDIGAILAQYHVPTTGGRDTFAER